MKRLDLIPRHLLLLRAAVVLSGVSARDLVKGTDWGAIRGALMDISGAVAPSAYCRGNPCSSWR